MTNKIFIKINQDNEVSYVHYMPFDKGYGLYKSVEELLEEGFLVDNIEEPIAPEGQKSVMKYNKETNKIYYDFIDIPLTKEGLERKSLEEKVKSLETTVAQMQYTFMMGGLI